MWKTEKRIIVFWTFFARTRIFSGFREFFRWVWSSSQKFHIENKGVVALASRRQAKKKSQQNAGATKAHGTQTVPWATTLKKPTARSQRYNRCQQNAGATFAVPWLPPAFIIFFLPIPMETNETESEQPSSTRKTRTPTTM